MAGLPSMLIDGSPQSRLSALDRGFCYGDGLFETIRFSGADAPLWQRHMDRLHDSCARLRLPPPDRDVLLRESRAVIDGQAAALVRITVTRGVGERGYAPSPQPHASRIVAAFAVPHVHHDETSAGLRVRRCALRLSEQPLLAGMKHLNRLEQVLARAECDDPAIAEGVLCDAYERVISATAANIFAVINGVLVTPALHRCGVAGVARAAILAVQSHAHVRDVHWSELTVASELFLSSSVRGVLPISEMDGRACAIGPVTRAMQHYWRSLGFL